MIENKILADWLAGWFVRVLLNDLSQEDGTKSDSSSSSFEMLSFFVLMLHF
jgi:hypothetical protein